MPFITFIYRIGNNKKTYYGKYTTNYISDDHEGLDDEIIPIIIDGLNKYRNKRNFPKISKIYVGIMSFSISENIPTYSSDKEISCFDFYYKNYKESKLYINGNLIE